MLFAYAGGFATAASFICTLVATTIVTAYAVVFAAWCYLIVVQDTAAGIDRVKWPDEPMFDWIPRALWVCAHLALWLVPAGFLARALAPVFLPESTLLRTLCIAGPILWLCFPFGLLSVSASNSPWQPFSFRILLGMLRSAPQTFLFYLVTGVLLALVAGLTWLSFTAAIPYPFPILAVVGSAVLLIHARLVGRLGWILTEEVRRSKPVEKKSPARKKKPKRVRGVKVDDPWAVPPEEAPRRRPTEVPTYEMAQRERVETPTRPASLDPEPEPYVVSESANEPIQPRETESRQVEQGQLQREIALRSRAAPNPPPRWPLFSGVYQFPGYETSRVAWLWLAIWGGAMAALMKTTVMLWPR